MNTIPHFTQNNFFNIGFLTLLTIFGSHAAERNGIVFKVNDGKIPLFTRGEFSLQLSDFDNKKHPKRHTHIIQFTRGQVPLIFPPSSIPARAVAELNTLAQEVNTGIAALQTEVGNTISRLHKLAGEAQGAPNPAPTPAQVQMIEAMLANPVCNKLIELAQESSLAGYLAGSGICQDALRALFAHGTYAFDCANRLPVLQRVKKEEVALKAEQDRNAQIVAERQQQEESARKVREEISTLHGKYLQEKSELEIRKAKKQISQSELDARRAELDIHHALDQREVELNEIERHNRSAFAALEQSLKALQSRPS